MGGTLGTVEVRLRPSFTLGTLLAAGHLAAGAALVPLALPVAVKVLVGLAVVGSGVASLWRQACLRASDACVRLVVQPDLRILLQTRAGRTIAGTVLPSSLVTPWLTVVQVAPAEGGRLRTAVLFPDSADAESLRALRVVLRWGAAAAASR